jgi:hypothetical protein
MDPDQRAKAIREFIAKLPAATYTESREFARVQATAAGH